MTTPDRVRQLDDELLGRILSVVAPDDQIYTITSRRPNKIVSINREGVEVETLRSEDLGSGPQLVPAWMIMTAWMHLRRHGRLAQDQLLNELNVKRSAFVCALLSQFRDVSVQSTNPTVIVLRRQESSLTSRQSKS